MKKAAKIGDWARHQAIRPRSRADKRRREQITRQFGWKYIWQTAATSSRTWLSLTWQTQRNSPAMTILRPSQTIQSGRGRLPGRMGHFKEAASGLEPDRLRGPSDVVKIITSLKKSAGDFCPNLEKIVSAAAVIPVSTAEVERVFSNVQRTVTDLRNRLQVETTNKLLLIHRCSHYLDLSGQLDYGCPRKQGGFVASRAQKGHIFVTKTALFSANHGPLYWGSKN